MKNNYQCVIIGSGVAGMTAALYLKRLNIINESIIQYNRDDFNKINDLYKDIIEKSEYKSYINYVKANDQTKDILSNFINIEL